jgi:hypothetical protein
MSRVACTNVGISHFDRAGNPIFTISQAKSWCCRLSAGGGTHCPRSQSLKWALSKHTPREPPVSSATLRQTCISAARANVETRMFAAFKRGRVSVNKCPGSVEARAPLTIRAIYQRLRAHFVARIHLLLTDLHWQLFLPHFEGLIC